MPEVTLLANGLRMGGWTSVSIRKSIEQFADEFSLEVTNQRVGPSGQTTSTGVSLVSVRTMADELDSADECVLQIDGETVLTGYVDEADFSYDSQRADLRISGRSIVGDLVDSDAEHKTGAWKKATLYEIARDLCLPYGITVVDADNLSGKTFERFRLEPGEKAFEALSRAAEMRGVLLTCNADGNMEMTRASSTPSGASLELGVNILTGGYTRSSRERFSVYRFKGQTSASDDWSGKSASQLEGEIDDPDVGRYRPMTVLSRKKKSRDDLGKRAVWERNVRAGRSFRYRCTVEEWTSQTGKLWTPNTLVAVNDPWSSVSQDLLVSTVDFTLTNGDRTTALGLVDRVAYDPEPHAFKPRPPEVAAALSDSFRGPLFKVGR